MKKPKAPCKLTLMDASKSSVGVRTRAKTLALQQSSTSYLQLRSRRLEKPPVLFVSNRRKSRLRGTPARTSTEILGNEEEKKQERANSDTTGDLGIEASSRRKARSTRGLKPHSLIGDANPDRTLNCTNKPSGAADSKTRMKKLTKKHKPTVHEMDELFLGSEQEQQQHFIEKYNFDPVNDKPLPGRYQWEKLDS